MHIYIDINNLYTAYIIVFIQKNIPPSSRPRNLPKRLWCFLKSTTTLSLNNHSNQKESLQKTQNELRTRRKTTIGWLKFIITQNTVSFFRHTSPLPRNKFSQRTENIIYQNVKSHTAYKKRSGIYSESLFVSMQH